MFCAYPTPTGAYAVSPTSPFQEGDQRLPEYRTMIFQAIIEALSMTYAKSDKINYGTLPVSNG
ncbi:hypothetical protein REMIM1_PC00180 (plasmid) [Rhizobium etli bv. mimosae str. Mim1]|nr:hypothetical protein REMIM1_PC00180 [Rhizobium etli bv. mimosae str. Mim1]